MPAPGRCGVNLNAVTGRPIAAMHLLIAAHAIHEGATLVTRNLSEFRRVAGLKLESWDGG